MLASSGYGIQRGFALHTTFLGLVKEGVARGEVTVRHDAQTLADIIVGALTGGIVNWTVDRTIRSRPAFTIWPSRCPIC